MKQLLVIILILLTNLASQAATYLIADQTAKDAFNFSSVVAGDSVLFQRSNSFYGTITVSNSGTAGNPIFFGSYGTGDDPVITGFTDVTAWTNLGSNIWESTSAVSTLTTCNIVLVNGVNTPMGRTPNFGTYYTYQTFSGNTSITSSDLSGTPNWTGADIVIRKAGWLWQAGVVSSQSGSTVTYADKQANAYPGQQQNNCGFFFQADIRTLDTQNEWYYNPTTKKISVYSTSEPTDVKVSSVTALVSFFGKHYVVFDGIHFTGGNADGLFFNTANYGEIKNCTIDYMGLYGLRTNNAYSLIVDNNIFSHCNHIGIGLGGSGSVGDTITNNTVTYTTMFPGVHATSYSGSAIILTGTDVLCQNNAIDYSGYNGITNPAMVSTIKYNFINHCVQNLSDGGGIYSGGSRTNVLIEGNIVTNTLGNLSGYTTTYSAGGEGIYLDSNSSNVTIRNNTSSGNTTYGIYLSSGTNNNLIEYNTCYNNGRAQISINNLFQAYGATHDNIVRNNIFIAKTSTQTAARFQSANEDDIFLLPAKYVSNT